MSTENMNLTMDDVAKMLGQKSISREDFVDTDPYRDRDEVNEARERKEAHDEFEREEKERKEREE